MENAIRHVLRPAIVIIVARLVYCFRFRWRSLTVSRLLSREIRYSTMYKYQGNVTICSM